MPRLPGPMDLPGGLPSGRSGRVIASVDTTAIGEGVAQFGREMQQAGAVLASRQQQVDTYDAERRFQEFKFNEERAFEEARNAIEPGKAATFAESYSSAYKDRAKQFLASVPQQIKPKYDAELFDIERRLFTSAYDFGREEQKRYTLNGLEDTLNNAVIPRALNAKTPEDLTSVISDAERLVDTNPALSSIEKDEAKRKTRERVQLAFAKALPPEERGRWLGVEEAKPSGSAIENTVSKIIGVESSGRANAKNPRSSASGLGQFTDGTWIATVRQHRPDLAGLSNRELLALKTDPALGREMTLRHTEDNAKALAAAGIPATEGNLYLAHFAGIGGARQALSAPDDASVSSVLGGSVVAANPFLKGKDIGWLKAWAAKKMGGSAGASVASAERAQYRAPILDAIPAETRQQILAATEDELLRKANHLAWERTSAYKLGIETGQVTSAADILNDQALRDADKATLLNALEAKQKDQVQTRDALAAVADPGRSFSQFDADDRKTVDRAFKGLTQDEDADPVEVVDQIYARTGVVPPSAVSAIRAAIINADTDVSERGLQVASAIMARNPNAFAGYDGSADIEKSALAFQHLTERGISAEDAARRVVEMNSPAYRSQIKAGDKETQEFIKTISPATITDVFDLDGSTLGMVGLGKRAADVGFTFEQQNAILSDFTEIAEERFRETGDPELAKAYAKNEMARVYGVTEFDGRRVFMKYPPEKAYPAVPGADGTPSHAYIYEQAAAAVKEAEDIDIPPSAVILSHIPNVTSRDWTGGRLPRYQLSYWHEVDGQRVLETIQGAAFFADPAAAQRAFDAGEPARREEWRSRATQSLERVQREEGALEAGERAYEASEGLPAWMRARDAEIMRERERMELLPSDETD